MKIIEINEFCGTQITIDEGNGDYKYYNRYSSNSWEENLGDSWELILSDEKYEKLEKLYQDFIKQKTGGIIGKVEDFVKMGILEIKDNKIIIKEVNDEC